MKRTKVRRTGMASDSYGDSLAQALAEAATKTIFKEEKLTTFTVNKFNEIICSHGWVLNWKDTVGAYATGSVGSACPGRGHCILSRSEYDSIKEPS